MSERITEKEIFRVQRDEDGYLSEVLELDRQFFAPTAKEATELALAAIVDADDDFYSVEYQDEKAALEDEIQRVEDGIKDLIDRKERAEVKLASLISINGLKVVEILEKQRLLELAIELLDPKHSMGIETAAFRLYSDLNKDRDINCCITLYRGRQITKKQ